jgi:hypothetical protein
MEMTRNWCQRRNRDTRNQGIRGDTGSARNAGLDGARRFSKVIQEQIGISGRVAGNDGKLVLKEKQEYKEQESGRTGLRKNCRV